MRLAQLLFKPKWQDKDASVRRAAISTGNEPEMLEALPRLVREDADASVRLAALKRLNDYENWRERSTADADKGVRDTSRATYLAMLCGPGEKPSLQRRIAELDTLDADEMERVATTSINRDLRAEALGRVKRIALLVDRAVADPDAQLRLAALQRVSDVNLLERIAERARKVDKTIARVARERVEAMRISAGHAGAIADKARLLCDRADALMRRPSAELPAELAALDAEWNTLGSAIPGELIARFRGAHALALRAADSLLNPTPPPAVVEPQPEIPVSVDPAVLVAEAANAAALTEAIASRARFDAALVAAQTEARNERERHKHLQNGIENSLTQFAAAIDAGNSAEAHRLHARIDADIKKLPETPQSLQRQLAPLLTRYAEMKRWQHWSNNQRRRVLCADIEALAGSGLHPDAVATRVRDAREEWQRMNANEGIDAEAEAAEGISKRFHGLCQRALRPTRGYFSKRQEVRKSHGEEVTALLERAAAIGDDSNDWKGMAALRSEASTALRSLDEVEPQARTALAKRLKDVIARMSTLGDAHDAQVEASKRRLIEQAVALHTQAGNANAARDARDLQKKWTTLGNGRRNVDQRQWREFRTACDAVFGQLDEARKQRDAQTAAQREQAQQLIADYEALAADELLTSDAIRARLRELDASWQSLDNGDRALSQRQQRAHENISLHLKGAARRQRLARYAHALRKYALLRALESGTPVTLDEWQALPASTPQFDTPLAARHAVAATPGEALETEGAREALVRLEFLAGIESPAEDKQLRMNHQVRRLSSRMRDGAATSPEAELSSLLSGWFSRAPQPLALERRFADAAAAAVDALP